MPLRPGVEYRPVVTPKQYKKAVKRYRKAIRRATPSVGVMFPGGPVVGVPAQYYYYYDDDDYEEMYGRGMPRPTRRSAILQNFDIPSSESLKDSIRVAGG